ncbi:O-antigen polysaccharide polymerase Wzy family protein [Streptomyces sp. RerS4]|uniref:O-antigen polysaccharide polymerase Wzy family protein n=1 Tax=Streptomyces sp. RerS4 TaxID=2942449 RepID=UPI00201C3834|nr:O-antigen polysaccharide polymerase Wzy family protein [Streptomyces sp. RerS4]UQX03079.1 O-antigen polysaccharide polymerase Wzy family protein [Streptomyces sp. RerS4]
MATDVTGPAVAPASAPPVEPVDESQWGRVTTPRTLLSRALSVPLALGFTLFLPFLVAVQTGAGARDAAFHLQLLLTMYAGARLSAMVLTSRRKLLQGSFWLFVYMAMGVAPLAQAVLGQVPTPVVGPRSDLTLAIGLVLLGCLAFDVGVLLARHRPAGRAGGSQKEPRPVMAHRRRLQLLTGLAFLGSAAFIVKLGGPAVFFSSRQEIIAGIEEAGVSNGDGQAGQALLRGFGTVPALLALLLYTRWLITSKFARRKVSVIVTWAGLAALNLVVNNPISNPRYWFLTVMFALLFTVFPVSAAMYRVALSMAVVIALLVFPFADRFRYDEKNYKPVETTSVLEPMALKDYDQIGMFANTITFSDSGPGHFYGRQLAGSIFFAVPRSVWPGKPRDTGVMVGQWMGTVNTNLSSPIWAELWLDFGPLGMGAGLMGIGYAAARVDRRYARRATRRSPPGSLISVVVPLVAGYSFILLRGPLLQASGRVAIAALCLALVATYRTDRHTTLR